MLGDVGGGGGDKDLYCKNGEAKLFWDLDGHLGCLGKQL